jgi:hypothetical protein
MRRGRGPCERIERVAQVDDLDLFTDLPIARATVVSDT